MRSVLAGLLLLGACASAGSPPPDARILEGVPFVEPGREHCGPAALASVLNYWHERTGAGSPVSREEIDAAIFSESAGGTLGVDLELFASGRGFEPRRVDGSIPAIRRAVDRGEPPIVRLDYGISVLHVDHFAVVIGYAPTGIVLLGDDGRPEFRETADFLDDWERTGRWMLVVLPQA
jgi:hypothetical protein